MIKIYIIFFIFSIGLLANRKDSLERELNQYKSEKEIDELYFKLSAELARAYRYMDRDRSFRILDSTKPIIKDYLPSDFAGDVYNVYGNLYFDIGDFSKALDNYYKCLSNALEIDDYGAVAFSYSDIAYCYYTLELYEISKYYYHKSFAFAQKKGVWNAAYPMSHAAISLGLNYARLGQKDSTFYFLDIGKKIRQEDDDPWRLAQIYSYYGMIYSRDYKDYNKSVDYFQKAIDLYDPNDDQSKWNESLGYIYNFLALIELDAGNYKKTQDLVEKSINSFKKSVKYLLPSVYTTKAQLYLAMGKKDSAIILGESALTMAKENGVVTTIRDVHETMAQIYKLNNKFEKSYYHLNQFYKIKDSLISSNHLTALNTIETTLKLKEKEERQSYLTKLNKLQTLIIIIIFIFSIVIIFLVLKRNKLQKESLKSIENKNKELNDANISKDKFFSIIAHDLKNPVSAFKGSLEMMNSNYEIFEEEERKEMILELYNTSKSMQELLNNLLTWARTQRGSFEYNPTDIDPCFIAENCKTITQQIANNKNIEIIINCKSENIEADPTLLNIVIMNLLVNAIKFSAENSQVQVNITGYQDYTIFEVKDYGVGMSPQETNKLFNLETSFSKKGTKNESGTGLGLIICYEFIKLHNGDIWVESEPNVGTSFFIKIPK